MMDGLEDLIISTQVFCLRTIEDTCFLKCDEEGSSKTMKSDCVSPGAPDALAWDWKMKHES